MIEIIPNWHPVFVHFTVALFTVSAIFFTLAKFVKNWRIEDQWLAMGYWSLWSGVLFTLGTVLAGWLAFKTVTNDATSYAVLIQHRMFAYTTLGLYTLIALWAVAVFRSKRQPSAMFVLIIILSSGVLFTTVWYGDELVYRHGLGVLASPSAESLATGAEIEGSVMGKDSVGGLAPTKK